MGKDKKISVSLNPRKFKSDEQYSIDCRVIYDQKSTKFKVKLFNYTDYTLNENELDILKNKTLVDYYKSWIEGIVRFEVDLRGKSFSLNGLGDRLPRYELLIIKTVLPKMKDALLIEVEDTLTYRKYVDLDSRFSFDSDFTFQTIYYDLIDNIYYELQHNLGVNLSQNLSEKKKGKIKAWHLFSHYEYHRFKNSKNYLNFGTINFGDWLGDEGGLRKDFHNFLKLRIKGEIPSFDSEYHRFIENEMPLKAADIQYVLSDVNTIINDYFIFGGLVI